MKRLEKLFDVYMILFFGLVFFINLYFIFTEKVTILYIIPASIVYLIIYFMMQIKTPHFGFILFLFVFISKVIMVLIIRTPPISDFDLMVNAGRSFALGDYSFKDSQYFSSWAYQSTFVVYQGLIIKLFGFNILLLKILNCLYIAFTTVLVYKIGKLLFGDYAGRAAGMIHAVYIPLFLFAPVLTNQHIATLFYYLALFFIVKKDKRKYTNWILAGLFLALGNTLRPIGIVFLTAILIWSIFGIGYRYLKQGDRFRGIKQFSICLVSYLIIFHSLSNLFILSGITDTGLKNNNPYWKFVTGLNEKSSGRFSEEDAKLLYSHPLNDDLLQKEKEIIKERLSIPPNDLAKLMINKVRYMWGDYEAGVFTFPHLLGKGEIRWGYSFERIWRQIQEFEKMFYLLIICLLLYGMIKSFPYDQKSKVKLLYYILTLYTGVHFLIEVSFRYKYAVMGLIFILAGNGANLLVNHINKRRLSKS